MQDPTYILFKSVSKKYPFDVGKYDQDVTTDLEEMQAKINAFPPEYQKVVSDMKDCLAYVAEIKARHAFSLGLDYGMSLMEELRPYPDLVM